MNDRIEFVRNVEGWKGDARLVRDTVSGRHFVVSGTNAMFTGWEVLVFEAEADGEVSDWREVAGGRGISHEEAIADLADRLAEPVS